MIRTAMDLALRTEAIQNPMAPAISAYLGNLGYDSEDIERQRNRQRIDLFAKIEVLLRHSNQGMIGPTAALDLA